MANYEKIHEDVVKIRAYKAVGDSDLTIRKKLGLEYQQYQTRLKHLKDNINTEIDTMMVWIGFKSTMDFAKGQAAALLQKTDNESVKVGCLRTLIDAAVQTVKMGQELGIYHKEPDRHEHTAILHIAPFESDGGRTDGDGKNENIDSL